MITGLNIVDKILFYTNQGLDIITEFYPQAKLRQNFRIREDDKNPSASLYLSNGRYKVNDFAGFVKNEDCFGVWALEKNISYQEAIFEIAKYLQENKGYEIFETVKNFYKYEYREYTEADCPVTLNEDGYFYIANEELSEYELSCLSGTKTEKDSDGHWVKKSILTDEVCKRVNLFSLKEYYQKKVDEETKSVKIMNFRSTEQFPILAFINKNEDNGKEWLKIYMPKGAKKNQDDGKDRRFKHLGQKPKSYIYNLDNIKAKYKELWNKAYDEGISKCTTDKEISEFDKSFEFKLERIIIATGGSDGLNLMQLGEFPIWFNSETEHIDKYIIKELEEMAHHVINIPDCDATGKREGRDLALKFLHLKTLWLDDYTTPLQKVKDVKDFVRVHQNQPVKDITTKINRMLEAAKPAQFWEVNTTEKGRVSYDFNPIFGFYFLRLNGFCKLADEGKEKKYAKITNHIVEELTDTQEIKSFFTNFLLQRQKEDGVRKIPVKLINTLMTSQKLSDNTLGFLHERTLDFRDYEEDSQYFPFSGKLWRVTRKGISEEKEFSRFTLKSKLIDELIKEETGTVLNMKELKIIDQPFFSIKKISDEAFDITINQVYEDAEKKLRPMHSEFLQFLIQTSRVHWNIQRTKMQENGMNDDVFCEKTKFDIAGIHLTEEEILEQKQHLVNKIFTIGYLLHRYKDSSRPWIPYAVDNNVTEDNVAEGGSGKTVFFSVLNFFKQVHPINGKDDIEKDNFWLEGVTKHTDLIFIDDVKRNFGLEFLYQISTGKMSVNAKFQAKDNLKYRDSAKFAVSSNYSLRDMNGSSLRRRLLIAFSNYFHAKTDNFEAREPKDDFGHNLFTDWSAKQWIPEINFLAQCLSFYLATTEKIEAPNNMVMKRSYLVTMGEYFKEWADWYFEEKINQELYKEKVIWDLEYYAKQKNIKFLLGIKPQTFTQKMEAWCKYNEHKYITQIRKMTSLIDFATGHPKEEDGKKQKTKEWVKIESTKETEATELFTETKPY